VSGKHIGASQPIEADWQHPYEKTASACSVYRFNNYEHRCIVGSRIALHPSKSNLGWRAMHNGTKGDRVPTLPWSSDTMLIDALVIFVAIIAIFVLHILIGM
jgi:hypothetical protein